MRLLRFARNDGDSFVIARIPVIARERSDRSNLIQIAVIARIPVIARIAVIARIPVIASEAKQSHSTLDKRDCFVIRSAHSSQ